MEIRKSPSAPVTAAGIVAIVGSALTLLGVLMGLFGLLVAPSLPQQAPMLAFARTMAIGSMALFLALAVFGIFTGVGLQRLRNWARISALVWAGITVPFALLLVIVMGLIPFPMPAQPDGPANLTLFIRLFLVLFYGIPLGVGVWWLILFTRKAIVAQFAMPVAGSEGIPTGTPSQALPVTRPTAPLPVIVIAWIFLISPLSFGFAFFMHAPAVLFGFAIRGPAGTGIYVLWSLLAVASGIGILRLQPWGYSLALGLQIVGLLSATISLLSPRFDAIMRESLSLMDPSVAANASYYISHGRSFALVFSLFPVIILVILLYYRPRFLEASAGAS